MGAHPPWVEFTIGVLTVPFHLLACSPGLVYLREVAAFPINTEVTPLYLLLNGILQVVTVMCPVPCLNSLVVPKQPKPRFLDVMEEVMGSPRPKSPRSQVEGKPMPKPIWERRTLRLCKHPVLQNSVLLLFIVVIRARIHGIGIILVLHLLSQPA